MKNKLNPKLKKIMRKCVFGYVLLFIVIQIFVNLDSIILGMPEEQGYILTIIIVPAIIQYYFWVWLGNIFGEQCSDEALEINKNPNTAYIIGFIFTILGSLGYLVYYYIQRRKLKRKDA